MHHHNVFITYFELHDFACIKMPYSKIDFEGDDMFAALKSTQLVMLNCVDNNNLLLKQIDSEIENYLKL